jgi:hypothetical protein
MADGTLGDGMFGGPIVEAVILEGAVILDGPVFDVRIGGGRFPARRLFSYMHELYVHA